MQAEIRNKYLKVDIRKVRGYMNLREFYEVEEERRLSEFAMLSKNTRGRLKNIEE